MGEAKVIYHVYLKYTDEHRYFGSKAALCNVLKKRDIGVECGYLNVWFSKHPGEIFENSFCTIRKGIVERNEKI